VLLSKVILNSFILDQINKNKAAFLLMQIKIIAFVLIRVEWNHSFRVFNILGWISGSHVPPTIPSYKKYPHHHKTLYSCIGNILHPSSRRKGPLISCWSRDLINAQSERPSRSSANHMVAPLR
jgi:hypothetical protein